MITFIAVAIAALAIAVTARLGTLTPGGAAAATSAPSPTIAGSPGLVTSPEPSATPLVPPSPTPIPLVPAPLTGRLVTAAQARQHPIAVMVDDHIDARPQAGFNAASVVWQAPAEGGVPRYMLVFQEQVPTSVGPIRSAREYYIEWASELKAMYVHHGGSPQAKETLAAKGDGTWVYNADGFRWEGRYVFRVTDRFPPHNVMTDGSHLRKLARKIGAKDGAIKGPWTFAPDAPLDQRPTGGTIKVAYPYPTLTRRNDTITYRYDRTTNTYIRYVNGSSKPQVDVADGKVVAPKNVVILRMFFGPLNDAHPAKKRLEANDVGHGDAWIATNGVTIHGTWRKASVTAPTLLFGPDGTPVTLTVGQTFVQVLALSYDFQIKAGVLPGSPTASLAPGASASLAP
ncbi:MAG TPA: DUF3048 domain-containing protein [Candidatus Limnocylindrales bacterium]|nr:DUF3048 domain-containing protein [Candidatus Limnocylindrales bacterium]